MSSKNLVCLAFGLLVVAQTSTALPDVPTTRQKEGLRTNRPAAFALTGARIVISTDAHEVDGLDLMPYGVQVARRAWLTKKDVVNTLPVAEFLAALAK